MKHLFIVLSILLVSTYAADDMGGNTGSIDPDGTYELPHNPHSGNIEPYTFQAEKPHIEIDPNHLYGFDQPLETCFNSENPPQYCFIPYSPSEENCSKHPKICNLRKKTPIAYISTKIGNDVSFIPHLSYNTHDKYCLIHYEYNDEADNDKGKVIDDPKTIEDNKSQPSVTLTYNDIKSGGIFKIFPINKNIKSSKNQKRCAIPAKDNSIFAIKVLPYEEVPKKIAYVEINGDPSDNPWIPDDNCENGFSKECVETFLKEIYSQAVIKVKIEKKTDTDYLNSQLIDIRMSYPEGSSYIYDNIKKKMNEIIADPKISQNKDSEHWHTVLAINKIRKQWHLDKCINENSVVAEVTDCKNFGLNPERESIQTKFFLYNSSVDRTPNPNKDAIVEIRIKQTIEDNKPQIHYYIYKNNKPYQYKKGDVIYTDNGYPVVPTEKGIRGSTFAFSDPFKDDLHDNYLSHGSLIVVPRRNGKSGFYALMHELGHSFGLTDVSVSEDYKITEKAIYTTNNEGDHGLFENSDHKVGDREYENTYASSETNLMSWQAPAGKKLRYRATPIVCTGGTKYYKASKKELIKDDLGQNIEIDVYDAEKGVWGRSIERLLKDGIENKDELNDEDWLELNQWECIRGNCYDSDYSSQYTTNARKTYYLRSEGSWCFDNTKISNNGKEKNRVTDEETYKADYTKIMNGKYTKRDKRTEK